eukprot:5987148-Amphidinium_carterae.1
MMPLRQKELNRGQVHIYLDLIVVFFGPCCPTGKMHAYHSLVQRQNAPEPTLYRQYGVVADIRWEMAVVRAHRSHRPPMSAEANDEYTAKASVEVQRALAVA